MFERFTKELRAVVLAGAALGAESPEGKTEPVHLLLALAGSEGLGKQVLDEFGVTLADLRADGSRRPLLTDEEVAALRTVGIDADEVFRRIEEAFGPDALDASEETPGPSRRGRLGSPFTAAGKKVLELSLREAIALRHKRIGTEHLLLALLRAGLPAPVSTVLGERGVSYDEAKRRVIRETASAV